MDEWESIGVENRFSLVRFSKELLSSGVRYLSDIGVDDTKTRIIDYRVGHLLNAHRHFSLS